jgi:hypothetical protein
MCNAHDENSEVYENAITLREAIHEEIERHRIPVERETIACFAHAQGILDFNIWLVWKSWTVTHPPGRGVSLSPSRRPHFQLCMHKSDRQPANFSSATILR